jgi:hypothetical protein
MSRSRKNLSFNPEVLKLAGELMDLRRFDELSDFLAQLVREEHERRHGPAILHDKPAPPTAEPVTPAAPVSYISPKRPRTKRGAKLPPEHRS